MNIHSSGHRALLGQFASFPCRLVSGINDRVFDTAGRAYWDFYGGHCVATTGHGHPVIAAAIRRQAEQLLFYSTAATIPVREAAAAALLAAAPREMGGVFFCNSGAEANENALKLAVQLTGRRKIAAFDGAFHGRTLFALAATDDVSLHEPLAQLLPGVMRLPFADQQALAAADFGELAAVIVEPVQSMAGVRLAAREWLAALALKAVDAGALVIFDEVQTGAGRLGTPFAAQHFGVTPDFITCAKGIASGVPMGALMVREELVDRIPPHSLGSTFGGSPLACAALLATQQVLEDENLYDRALKAEQALRSGLSDTVVREVRGIGLLLGLDAGEHAPGLKRHLLECGILVGGSADATVLRLMPPLTVTDAAIGALLDAVASFDARKVA